jgi:hypothetical protein
MESVKKTSIELELFPDDVVNNILEYFGVCLCGCGVLFGCGSGYVSLKLRKFIALLKHFKYLELGNKVKEN